LLSKAIVPRPNATFSDQLNLALQTLYGGEIGSRVVINESLKVSLNRVVIQLAKQGICAGIQDGGNADEVCIGDLSRCQGYHSYTCGVNCDKGTVGWAPGSVRDTWVKSDIVVPPTPEPEPTPEPTPTLCNDFTGFRDIKKLSHVGGRVNFNTTPEGCNRDKCNELGWTGRLCCPLGTFQGTQEECEKLLVGSSVFSLLLDIPIASVNSVETNPTSPFLGILRVTPDFQSATVRVCGEKSPTTCSNGVIGILQ